VINRFITDNTNIYLVYRVDVTYIEIERERERERERYIGGKYTIYLHEL
jgi:hypothetical protein